MVFYFSQILCKQSGRAERAQINFLFRLHKIYA